MQRNSNQQPFTVSIRAKREQLRNQIRREQLQEYFRQKRIQYFSNSQPQDTHQSYKKFFEKIKQSPLHSYSRQDIENEVRNLFDQKPQQELNFHALANLIIKFPDSFFDYQTFIIREENLAFHSSGYFAYCFGLYFGRLNFEIDSRNLQKNFLADFDQMDRFLAAIFDNFFTNFKLSHENLYCFQFYTVCYINILYLMEKEDFFPINMFNATVSRLRDFYKLITDQKAFNTRELKLRVTELINEIVRAVNQNKIRLQEQSHTQNYEPVDIKPEYFIKNRETEHLMKAAAQIFEENIKDASQERANCFRSIFLLSKFSAINAGEYLFTEKNIRELIFQMINQKSEVSVSILSSFTYVLPALSNRKMTVMLENSLHINLVIFLRDCLQQVNTQKDQEIKSSESLFQVLKLIEILLEKTQKMNDPKFRHVFRQMDMNSLGDLLESMNHFRYSQKIEEIWVRIIENYYSEEMEDQNMLYDENFKDYSNYQQDFEI